MLMYIIEELLWAKKAAIICITTFAIVGLVCAIAPRPQAVALLWSATQVEQGKMTLEEQNRLLSLYMPVVVEEKK